MTTSFEPLKLTLSERIFRRVWCYKPPAEPFEPREALDPSKPPPMDPDPLARTRRVYGDRLEASLPGRVFVDIGCGLGAQVIAAAEEGARLAVGVDKTAINLAIGSANAQQRGVTDRVHFTTDAVSTLGTEWADVVLSQNSFEHFEKPESILGQAHAVLKPGGQFFVTFGPSWWHPYGVHHMFMIRLPWAHGVFSERTILRVRQLYRPDKPSCWREVSLNQMTIRKLLRLVEASGFSLTYFDVTPIRLVPKRIARMKSFREWTTADVSVILTKPVP